MNDPIGPTSSELEHAISIYRSSLQEGDLFEFDLTALDRIGMPIKVVALFVNGVFNNDGFGYGSTSQESLVGALGEMAETYHTSRALASGHGFDGFSYRQMQAMQGVERVIDPLTLCLPAGSNYDENQLLRWVPVRQWSSHETHWAPRECIAIGGASYQTISPLAKSSGQPSAVLFPPITCGLGAGISLDQALSHAVFELLQRDGNCTAFRAMDQGIDIDLDSLVDPGIKALIEQLAQHGLQVRPKLASTEFGLSNLYVIADKLNAHAEPFPLMATACGEAVHANRERALRKALLEYTASRARKAFMHGPLEQIAALTSDHYRRTIIETADPANEEPRAVQEMARWLTLSETQLRELLAGTVFSAKTRVAFSDLPSVPDQAVASAENRMQDLAQRLDAAGLSIFYYDASPGTANGPTVVKAIVPGLEGETMSYNRIGERGVRRLLERGENLIATSQKTVDQQRILLTPEAETRLGGDVYLDCAKVAETVGACYPLYREPSSHTAQKLLKQRLLS